MECFAVNIIEKMKKVVFLVIISNLSRAKVDQCPLLKMICTRR